MDTPFYTDESLARDTTGQIATARDKTADASWYTYSYWPIHCARCDAASGYFVKLWLGFINLSSAHDYVCAACLAKTDNKDVE